MIKLQMVQNGFIVTDTEGGDEGQETTFAFEDVEDTDVGEVECFARLLRHLVSQYGPSTSKYSDARIYIEVKPGENNEKYEEEGEKIATAAIALLDTYAGKELPEQAKNLLNALNEAGYWHTIAEAKCVEI